MKIILNVLIFSITISSFEQQFSYKPKNPAFGGDTFNYNWLLDSANSQNGFTQPRAEREEVSDLDAFGDSLNNQILNQISRELTSQQLESIDGITDPGTYTYGDLNVEVFESDEGLVINILDTTNGEQTQVIVPDP